MGWDPNDWTSLVNNRGEINGPFPHTDGELLQVVQRGIQQLGLSKSGWEFNVWVCL